VLNLNHGLLPETPFGNVQAFVNAARNAPAAGAASSGAGSRAGP
jgi:hypothetical protein